MNKLIIILPIFLLSMCSDAPVTPPAHACSPRLDGKPTNCPPPDFCLYSKWSNECNPKPIIPRESAQGEIDITSPYHLQSLQMMFMRNARRNQIEENATLPSDAINNALMEFNYGQNGTTEQEELLQLPSNGD